MTGTQNLDGRCLCGAVTVSAKSDNPRLRACHCDMCRRHTSGAFMSVSIEPGSLVVEGPAQSYRSSDWAERGFCQLCGSTLWYGTIEDGMRHPAAGLFENAAGAELKLEFYADRCPDGYSFAGDHRRMSSAETEAMFAGDAGATK